MKKLVAIALVCCFYILPAQADYRHQVTGNYTDREFSDRFGLQYKFHFKEVKTNRGPWQLADFLSPVHQLAIDIYDDDRSDNNLFFSGQFVLESLTLAAGFDEGFDHYEFEVGYYFLPVSKLEVTLADRCDRCDFGVSVDYQHYFKLGKRNGVDLQVGWNDIGDNDYFFLSGDYYFNARGFAGAGIHDGDFQIQGGYWFIPQVGADLSYRFDAEIFAINVTGRF